MKNRRAILMAVAALAVIGAVLTVRWLYFGRPVGTGPAGPAVDAAPFQKPWTDRKVLILGMGDSVTAGFGAPDGHGYFDRLVSNPPDEYEGMKGRCLGVVLPNHTTLNIAVSGSTSQQHLDRQLPQIKVQPADVLGLVILTSGGNDLIHNYGKTPPKPDAMYGATMAQARPWISAYRDRLMRLLLGIKYRFPGGCHIFIGNIYDPSDGTGELSAVGLPAWPDGPKILAAYNEVIDRVAGADDAVHRVDLHGPFLGHGLFCARPWGAHYRSDDPHFWYSRIVEDPNDRGHDAIRRLFLVEIMRIMR